MTSYFKSIGAQCQPTATTTRLRWYTGAFKYSSGRNLARAVSRALTNYITQDFKRS